MKLESGEILLLYEDDGPEGICGQAMSITSPWRRLIVAANPDEAHDMVVQVGDGIMIPRRKNPRVTAWFSDDSWHQMVHGCYPIIA